ncbi:MAG: DUF3025 domain-containing protein [Steroidobacter sp.]
MQSALSSLASALETPPPWLLPHTALARAIVNGTSSESVADALNAARGDEGAIRFVAHSELPAGQPYESFIARTACVPTRDNLHDLFNGLMWLSYPKTKRRLNVLQARQIELLGATGPRGALRDAMTVFDENAAILQAPVQLTEALRQRDWRTLFVSKRELWQDATLVVFGHALLEKLMQPRKGITAHVWVMDKIGDDALAASLTIERLSAKDFLPLPVLGVPGWWAANEDPRVYDDAEVFRPPR